MVCPPPQFQKESEKEARFLANPLSSFPPFAGATLGCHNVRNPQFSVDLWHVRLRRLGYNNVSLGWVYSRVSLSVWPLAVVRLAFTDKIRLTGREMLPCFCWLLFQWPTAVKQAKFAAAKNFYCRPYAKLVCYAIACFLAAWWKFVCRTRLHPIFPKHFVLFVWFYLEGLLYSQKTNIPKSFDRVLSSFLYTFYSQFSTRIDWKSVAKRATCSKNPLFFALRISFIQWGINETITKLSWKFEENRTSGRFYFFKQKKEHKKWNPL